MDIFISARVYSHISKNHSPSSKRHKTTFSCEFWSDRASNIELFKNAIQDPTRILEHSDNCFVFWQKRCGIGSAGEQYLRVFAENQNNHLIVTTAHPAKQ